MPDLNAFTVDSAMKMIAGTARSMGITVKANFLQHLQTTKNMARLSKE